MNHFVARTDGDVHWLPNIVVIGVENMENFRMIRKQRTFFEEYLHTYGLSDKVLWLFRI